MDRDAKWLAWFEQQFSNLAGSDRQIDLEEFKEALHVKEVSMISRVIPKTNSRAGWRFLPLTSVHAF